MHNCLFVLEDACFQDRISYPDIVIPSYDVTFLTGPSGVGKTTLLKLFNRTYSLSKGTIYYKRKNLLDYSPLLLRKEVLLVSQSVFLFNDTIEGNFKQFYAFREETPPESSEIKRFLSLCMLDFPLDKDCLTMSGGERQRAALAIYLSFQPSVLLLDEPTSALDEQNAFILMGNIVTHAKERKMTLIVVSHNGRLTDNYADCVISLANHKREEPNNGSTGA